MPDCTCAAFAEMVRCEQFRDHIEDRLKTAMLEAVERERAEDERDAERVLYGVPGGSEPRGVIRA